VTTPASGSVGLLEERRKQTFNPPRTDATAAGTIGPENDQGGGGLNP
jgi:hypothetical protein